MRIFNLKKVIPFLLTLIILILISLNNQKESTRLKLLIWYTPSLSLGNYILLSTGTGFILSYLINNYISSGNSAKSKELLKYKSAKEVENANSFPEDFNNITYYNTLIERDVKDPLPTVTASFRVIGKTKRNRQSNNKNNSIDYNINDYLDETELPIDRQETKKNGTEIKTLFNDWEDDTYVNW